MDRRSPMTEDLLTKIQREVRERLHQLRGVVEEHDRLTGELRTLDAAPEPPAAPESPESPAPPELVPKPPAALGSSVQLNAVPEHSPPRDSSATAVGLPARPRLPRTRTVSPSVARMRPPRRPSPASHGLALATVRARGRFSAQNPLTVVDLFPGDDPLVGINEVDVEAEVYERSL